MKQLCIFTFCLLGVILGAAQSTDLMRDKNRWSLPEGARWQGQTLEIKIPPDTDKIKNLNTATCAIPLEGLRGKGIRVSGEISGENIDLKTLKTSWLGFKFMVVVTKKNGHSTYPQYSSNVADFPWKKAFVFSEIPEDAVSAVIHLGLQGVSGTVRFRNLRVEAVESMYAPDFKLPENFRCSYSKGVLSRPAGRGVMSPKPANCTEKDLEDMASWGVNLIRWQIKGVPDKKIIGDTALFEAWIRGELDRLEKFLPLMERLGMQVVIDIHDAPGGRYASTGKEKLPEGAIKEASEFTMQFRLFMEDEYLNSLERIWVDAAKRFKGKKAVWGYDILNEPSQSTRVRNNYINYQWRIARAIREVDAETPIIVESNAMCAPQAYYYMMPLPLMNIIYAVHFYDPGDYTHQHVGKDSRSLASFISYPQCVGNDRNYIRKQLAPVRAFQNKYGAIIYCGEFSVIRWAPGGAQYLQDLINVMEEYRWNWTYHAFREYNGWSVEHDDNAAVMTPTKTDTERKKVLLNAFRLNQKKQESK